MDAAGLLAQHVAALPERPDVWFLPGFTNATQGRSFTDDIWERFAHVVERSRAFPDHQPEWDARRGTAELTAAYRAVGLTWEDFDGPRYTRLKHLQRLLDEGLLDGDLRWREAA